MLIFDRWAAGLFMYQSLDAIDGYVSFPTFRQCLILTMRRRKQARRTKMAGPLGEMFDHGSLLLALDS